MSEITKKAGEGRAGAFAGHAFLQMGSKGRIQKNKKNPKPFWSKNKIRKEGRKKGRKEGRKATFHTEDDKISQKWVKARIFVRRAER